MNAEIGEKNTLIVDGLIKGKMVRVKEKRGRAKEVPGCLKANTVTKGSVELSCSKPGSAKDDNVVLCQVSMKKVVVISSGRTQRDCL